MSTTITNVIAREIIDSRGNPTVEVDVKLSCGALGRAAVPSGASTGENEAIELRDSSAPAKSLPKGIDGKKRFLGKGVQAAVNNVKTVIAPAIIGMDSIDQIGIDRTMIKLDGTKTKAKPQEFDFRPPGKIFIDEYAKFIASRNDKLGSSGKIDEVRAYLAGH